MTNVTINGQVRKDCLRKLNTDSPISDVLTNDYTCGFLPNAAQAAATKCPIAAGSEISFSYWHGQYGNEGFDDRFIAQSHKGPIIVHMAKSETGSGNVWFKIYQEAILSYDPSNYNNNKWASPDRLLLNNGKITVTIPADISPGNYLIRIELLALHSAYAEGGAQPYVRCAELTVTGSGSANPQGIAIPGPEYATRTSPGVKYDLYNDRLAGGANYPFPGKQVYVAGAVTPTPSSPSTTAAPTVTTGQATTAVQPPVTTGRATTGRVTTGRVTTGRATTAAQPPVTTGRATTAVQPPVTTGRTTTTDVPSSSGSTSKGACQDLGSMVCVGESSYQTCTNARVGFEWSQIQQCPRNTKCSPAGKWIYCL